MWMRPEFEQLRNFVETASCKTASTSAIVHGTRENISISNEFGMKIESRSVCNRKGIDHDPILQNTDASTKFWKFALNSC